MTILDFNTTKKQKLSIYLSTHLKDKKYERINRIRYLSFTQKEARDALMIALKMALNKKDAKEFLSCLRDKMIICYGASDASEKILEVLK